MKKTYIIALCIVLTAGAAAFFNREPASYTPTPDGNATSTPVVTKPAVKPYGVLVVSLGQTVTFSDFSLKLNKVESDSRCPANANCVWAGTTTVRAEFVDANGTTTKVIELGKTTTFGSAAVTLIEVVPQTITTHTITPSEYRFTLNVQKKTNTTVPAGKCYVGGCSSEVCSGQPDVASNCIYREEFMCYKSATCERQSNGSCGWTETTALRMCLKDAAGVNLQ